MKKTPLLLLGSLVCLFGTLQADDDLGVDIENAGSEKMLDSQDEDKKAFRLSFRGDWIQSANIDEEGFSHDKLKYAEAEGKLEGVVWYNPDCEEGLGLGIGYQTIQFDWDNNPYFDKTWFPEATFSVFAFSKRVCRWLWQAQATINWQTGYSEFWEYTNYNFLVWGRYEYIPNCLYIHTGVLAQTGMKVDHVYPVIGFDWTISDCWKLNVIYPINISAVYTITENLNVALAGRIWYSRRRVGKNEPLSKGIFQYRNNGLELALNYDGSWFSANVHGGYTFGGKFKISDHNNHHKHNFNVDSSAYVGGELAVKF